MMLLVLVLSVRAPHSASRNEFILLLLCCFGVSLRIEVRIPIMPEVLISALCAFTPDDLLLPVEFHDFIVVADEPGRQLPPGLPLDLLVV